MPRLETDPSQLQQYTPSLTFFQHGRFLSSTPISSPELRQDGFGFTSLPLFVSALVSAASLILPPTLLDFGFFLSPSFFFLVLGFVLITVPKPSPSWIWTSHLASRGEGCRGRFQRSARRGCFRIFQGLVICSLVCHAHAMPLAPHGAEEAARAVRRSGTVLQADRVVPSKRGTGVRCC